MGRKRKQTRKYKPRDEFRRNKSPLAMGHINYVFGETDTKYKSMGLTTNPTEKDKPFITLKYNPKSGDDRKSYLKTKVLTTRKDMLSDRLFNFRFSKDDMPVVRHITKKYKKATNRKKHKKKR